LIFMARGKTTWRQHYQVRLAAAVREAGRIELAAECVRNGPPDFNNRTTWEPLVELPRKSQLALARWLFLL
jgi:hypothetical protein